MTTEFFDAELEKNWEQLSSDERASITKRLQLLSKDASSFTSSTLFTYIKKGIVFIVLALSTLYVVDDPFIGISIIIALSVALAVGTIKAREHAKNMAIVYLMELIFILKQTKAEPVIINNCVRRLIKLTTIPPELAETAIEKSSKLN